MTDLIIGKTARPDMTSEPRPGFQSLPPVQYVYAAEEDRCAVRHKVSIPARIRFSCSSSFDTEVTDLSLAGFCCDALLETHAGTRCWITLPGLGSLEAETVHHDNRGLGCAFAELINPAVLDRFVANYPPKG